MLKNILKTAWRNLFKTRVHSFINISGLSIGMAVTILIGCWIHYECSYEKYNSRYDRIARVMQTTTLNGEISTDYSMPIPLATELRHSYGNVFKRVALSWWTRDHILSFGEKKLTEGGKFMEPEGPEILSLKMLEGSRSGLNDPASILLSASAAKALFGNETAMSRTIRIDNKVSAKVTGVYEDVPDNSQFAQLRFIAPWRSYLSIDEGMKTVETNWGWDAVEIFVQLTEGAALTDASAAIRNVKLEKVKDSKDLAVYKPVLFLHPMSRWHLYAEFKNGVNTGGRIQMVWLFGTIGLFVLVLACVNFMNLSTARSEKRAREVGIRKAIGSTRGLLIGQFFGESLLAAAFAFVLALILAQVALPFFNTVTGKKMSLPWDAGWFWAGGLGFNLFTGFLAGVYPALYLSSFRPVLVLKGTFRVGRWAAVPRKALVILQFSVSIVLIIGTMIVHRQVQFVKDRPVGYNREALLSLQMTTPEFFGKQETLRNALLRTGVVEEMAESSSPATWIWLNNGGFDWPGKDPSVQTEFGDISVTHGYGRTVGWQFSEGRDFSRDMPTDSAGLVLNEAAVRFMGLKKPVGEEISRDKRPFRIIGVIKDMVMESPYEPVRPAVYYLGNAADANFIFIRMKPGLPVHESVSRVRDVFREYVPSAPFDYRFADEEYAKKFGDEERTGRLASAFTILAVFISCMGLFGMASFVAEQRIKEIGIRKVLGATVFGLWRLLSTDLVGLVGIAFAVAAPFAWWAMHRWLQQYAYHTTLSWWIFAAAGLGALFIALSTVSYQAIRTALTNPAKSLRPE